MSQDIKIVCVPPAEFGSAWRVAGDVLLRGLAAAEMPVIEAMDSIKAGTRQLWLITRASPAKLLGCFLTEVAECEDGTSVVWVSALSGSGIKRWGEAISDRMAWFAKDEGCAAVRFVGRDVLARVYGKCRVIGRIRDDLALMERVVA